MLRCVSRPGQHQVPGALGEGKRMHTTQGVKEQLYVLPDLVSPEARGNGVLVRNIYILCQSPLFSELEYKTIP